MHFGTGISRDVLCRSCRAAGRAMLVTTSATGANRTTRVQGRRHSVDWGGHAHLTFPEVVPEIDSNPEHKSLNFNTRALLLLRRLACWNKHSAKCTTNTTRSSRRARHAQHVTSRHVASRLARPLVTCPATEHPPLPVVPYFTAW